MHSCVECDELSGQLLSHAARPAARLQRMLRDSSIDMQAVPLARACVGDWLLYRTPLLFGSV